MGRANYSISFNAVLSSSADDMAIGTAVLKTATGYLASTLANRTAEGRRSDGIALDAVEASRAFRVAHDGLVDASESGLPDGAANDYVVVADDATLTRTASPATDADIIGVCPGTNGDFHLRPGTVSTPGGGDSTGTEHLAALRAKVGSADKETTVLLGNSAAGDDAGDSFYWDAASTDADDDGLTVKPTAISGGSPGRWKRIHDGTKIHAKWFGAKGDNGVTDNATPLANAKTACFATSPPTPLVLSPGTYGTSVQLTGPATPGWKIIGAAANQGAGTKIKATAAMESIVHFAAHCVVEGVVFDGNSNAKYGVSHDNATMVRFVDCNFTNNTHDGIRIIYGDVTILENCSAIGNGVIFCSSTGVEGQYDGYISANTGHDQTQLLQTSTSADIALVVEADQHTVVASFPSGTVDFTTLGLRYGDVLRLGGGSTGFPDSSARFFQITQVLNPTTILVAGMQRLPTAGGYADWAISRGDGVRNAGPGANNSQMIVRGGNYFGNAGSGIAVPGAGQDEVAGSPNFIFGLDVNGAEPQYNGAAGVLVGQATCNAAPSALAGITYAVTNGSPTVTASASVDGLISPGAFFHFATQPSVFYRVTAVSGVTITLAENYSGANDAATTISSFDSVGAPCTNISIRNQYAENDAAAQIMVSQCSSGEIDAVHGFTFTSANPDILYDTVNLRVRGGQFIAPGVVGTGGYNPRSTAEEIHLGDGFCTVPQGSVANMRDGYQQTTFVDPASTLDSTRSFMRIVLSSADVTMTATPTIAAPSVDTSATNNYSQIIFVQNSVGVAHTLVLQDESVLPGSLLNLRTPTLALPQGAWVVLMWEYQGGRWQEICRSEIDGIGVQAMADANQTVTPAVYTYETIRTTGAITADRDLVLPTLTDAQATKWTIVNTCTGAFGVVVKCTAGTTVTVANGKSAIVLVDSNGVTRITADT